MIHEGRRRVAGFVNVSTVTEHVVFASAPELLYNGSASALVSVTAPPSALRAPRGKRLPVLTCDN